MLCFCLELRCEELWLHCLRKTNMSGAGSIDGAYVHICLDQQQRVTTSHQLVHLVHDVFLETSCHQTRCLIAWRVPCLLQESEYAAWTLVNGYRLNHAAVSVHRLQDFKWVCLTVPCTSFAMLRLLFLLLRHARQHRHNWSGELQSALLPLSVCTCCLLPFAVS